jgi:hypothetical protein
VGFRDLTLWSFLMATAHGAGLMLMPVLLGMGGQHGEQIGHDMQMGAGMDMGHAEHAALVPAAGSGPLVPLAAIVVHTMAQLLVAALIALVVYQSVGLSVLRRAWLNLDLIWVITLIIAGVLILLV